ncbi:hypothetical protein ACPPVQ_08755 [Diaminobutyricibacter sp. McL0618]|uniref:hypothetical protein n=1 Tax=Leifsonia sp. McL0618 TaxID=3415677 RepID=UPI003CE6C02B
MFPSALLIAVRSLPELQSWKTIAIRIGAVPVAAGLFYLALASGGGTTRVGSGDAIAAAASVGAINAAIAANVLIAHDRFESTLPYVTIASRGRTRAWAARLSTVMAIGIAASVVTVIVTLAVAGELRPGCTWVGIVAVLVVSSASAMGLGFLLGALSLIFGDSLLLANIAEYVLPLICGAVAPLSVFPDIVADTLRWIPPASAIEAGRLLANEGAGPAFWSALGAAICSGAAALTVGLLAWHSLERRARRDGSIESLSI